MDTPYMNGKCNLGRALQGMLGGALEHTEHKAREKHLGDKFSVSDIEDRLSLEQIETNIDSFLVRQGFYLAGKQLEKNIALRRGVLKKYEHKDYPSQLYEVAISAPRSIGKLTVDVRIFDK